MGDVITKVDDHDIKSMEDLTAVKKQYAAGDTSTLTIYRSGGTGYAEEYRRRSLVIGKPIQVLSPAGARSAVALDVDNSCRLIVRYDDGSVASLSSAEISIRPCEEW